MERATALLALAMKREERRLQLAGTDGRAPRASRRRMPEGRAVCSAPPTSPRRVTAARVRALERSVPAATFPRFRRRGQSGKVPIAVVALAALQGGMDLHDDRGGEHVQHLVALVARGKQPLRGEMHLGRVVVGEVVCEHLVHGQVKANRDRLAIDDHLGLAGAQPAIKLGVIGADHNRAHLGIGEVLDAGTDARQRLLTGDQ